MRIGADCEPRRAGTLSVDWMHVTRYATPGTFVSRVFDGGASTSTWGVMTWTADNPAGTRPGDERAHGRHLAARGRVGPRASSGTPLGATGQYLQYQAVLSSTDTQATPVLRRVEIGYNTDARQRSARRS